MKLKIAIGFAYVLALAAIAISLWRCEPFTIDAVAVLANILALMVTILLGVIAYNYFIQKEEIDKYKRELADCISKEVMDIYVSIIMSFGAAKNPLGVFPLGVKVLEKLKESDEQNITQVCTLLNSCFNKMSKNEKTNPVIMASLAQLSDILTHYTKNAAASKLLSDIKNG